MRWWHLAIYAAFSEHLLEALAWQGFKWAVDQERWHDRVASIPAVFDAAAADLGAPRVTAAVVRAVWNRLLPGTRQQTKARGGGDPDRRA
jgi:hypothetical protein